MVQSPRAIGRPVSCNCDSGECSCWTVSAMQVCNIQCLRLIDFSACVLSHFSFGNGLVDILQLSVVGCSSRAVCASNHEVSSMMDERSDTEKSIDTTWLGVFDVTERRVCAPPDLLRDTNLCMWNYYFLWALSRKTTCFTVWRNASVFGSFSSRNGSSPEYFR